MAYVNGPPPNQLDDQHVHYVEDLKEGGNGSSFYEAPEVHPPRAKTKSHLILTEVFQPKPSSSMSTNMMLHLVTTLLGICGVYLGFDAARTDYLNAICQNQYVLIKECSYPLPFGGIWSYLNFWYWVFYISFRLQCPFWKGNGSALASTFANDFAGTYMFICFIWSVICLYPQLLKLRAFRVLEYTRHININLLQMGLAWFFEKLTQDDGDDNCSQQSRNKKSFRQL
jgi:hypothetical protein